MAPSKGTAAVTRPFSTFDETFVFPTKICYANIDGRSTIKVNKTSIE